MQIILTGATSFLGQSAARTLRARGHEVTALRHSFEEEPDRLPAKADVWLHFAWAGKGSAGRSDPAIQQENVEMTLRAVQKAAAFACGRFVFAGSQAEYGHAQDGMLKREYGETCPVSEYGKAKREILERVWVLPGIVTEACGSGDRHDDGLHGLMSYIHLRLFSVYGAGDHEGSLVNTLLRGLERGETIALGACTQMWNYLYIDDAAEAIALLCEQGEAGIYNIAGEDNRPLREYVDAVRELMGGGAVAFGMRADNAEGAADLGADIRRIQTLGFRQQISFREGIVRTAEALGVKI